MSKVVSTITLTLNSRSGLRVVSARASYTINMRLATTVSRKTQ